MLSETQGGRREGEEECEGRKAEGLDTLKMSSWSWPAVVTQSDGSAVTVRQRPTPSGASPREENFDNLDLLFLLSLPKAPVPKVNLTLYDDGFLYFVVFDGE